MSRLENFLDDEGKIKHWPSKVQMKKEILLYLSQKFSYGILYTEKEVNAIIDNWHTFGDYFILRRGMIEYGFLSRPKNGSKYWREEYQSYYSIRKIILDNYDVNKIFGISQLNNGIGSNSFYILSDKGEFIFKDIENSHMNTPENEEIILNRLKYDGIPVPDICKSCNGKSVIIEDDKKYHMQTFVNGKIYKRNTAPDWLLFESAEFLGKIQSSLKDLSQFPIGISQGFYNKFKVDVVITNHMNTLKMAVDNEDLEIAQAIEEKIKVIKRHKEIELSFNKITCSNTHGDYSINQIICGKDEINAVIDFTSACVHPVGWEVIRSYSLADVKCIDGLFDEDNLKKYIESFLKFGKLNDYDIKIMPVLYLYQNLICDYFHQYYYSNARNKNLLLDNAMFTLKQCKYLSENII